MVSKAIVLLICIAIVLLLTPVCLWFDICHFYLDSRLVILDFSAFLNVCCKLSANAGSGAPAHLLLKSKEIAKKEMCQI